MATRETRIKTYDEATLAARRAAHRQAEDKRRLKYPSMWLDPTYYADPRTAYAATYLTSQAQSSPYMELTWYRQQLAAMAEMLAPEQEEMLNEYLDRGLVSPGVAAGLTEVARTLRLDPDTLNAIASLDSLAQAMTDESTPVASGSEGEKGRLARALGGFTRPLFSLLSMPYEVTAGTIRNIAGGVAEQGAAGGIEAGIAPDVSAWQQSLGGQYIRGLIDPNYSSDLGEGWFPSGEVHARQVVAARNAAPLVHGRAWTPGRGAASLFIEDPDSRTYRNVSGLIDLVSNVVLDPLVIAGTGGASARAIRAGARTAAAVRVSGVAKAKAAEEALATPEAWLAPREVVEAAADHVRAATKEFTAAQRKNGQLFVSERLADAENAYDRATDALALARDDALHATGKATVPPERGLIPPAPEEIAGRVKSAVDSLGEQGLGALAARVSGAAPDLPGTFTRELPAQNSSLIGAHDGVDAIVTLGKDDLITKSVDELVEIDGLKRAVKGLNAPKRAKDRALKTLTDTGAGKDRSYGRLLELAARDRTGGTIAAALRADGLDGVTDVFRLTGTEGGVWWVGRDIDVVVQQVDGEWGRLDRSLGAVQGRVRTLEADQRKAATLRGKAQRDANAAKRVATELADQFERVMSNKLDLANADTAVQTAVEYSIGVRRNLGGRPQLEHEAVKEFFFGSPKGFDQKIGAELSKGQKGMLAADRALMATVTLGTSELLRAAKKVAVNPLLARARERVLADLVRLGDTPENLGRLHRLTSGKVDANVLRAALRAQNEDEVLEALAPSMGVQVTRPLTPNVINLARSHLAEVRMGRSNDHLFNRGMRWIVDEAERMGTIAPRGMVALNFADPRGSANDLRNYLDNIPNLNARVTDEILGEYLGAANETGRARAVMNGFDKVYDALVDYHAGLRGMTDETQDALRTALRSATRLYDGGRAKVNNWWNQRYVADAKPSVITAQGEKVLLPGPQLEAELARGGLVLPSMRELRDAIGRWGQFLESKWARKDKRLSAEHVRDVVSVANDYWRSSVLLRPAYVLRNIGEMQSRMFLVGHSSIFTHPLGTVAFAVAANTRNPKIKALAERFTKANRTATGHSLSKVGLDDMENYDETVELFNEAAILASGSRLDMRTHRAMEAFHGLEEVAIHQPGFNLGLAEQLLNLRMSKLTRLVAGVDPPEVARAVANGVNREDAVVNWLLSSKLAHPIRQLFADNDYSMTKIFGNPRLGVPGDPVALREYLFTSNAAIAKRLSYYTRDDPDLLEFVKTGVLPNKGKGTPYTMKVDAADAQLYGQAMAIRSRRLSRHLKPYIDRWKQASPDTVLHMRVLRSKGGERPFQAFDSLFDWFFDWAGRMENAIAVGPEFAYSYHQKLAQLLPAIKAESRQEVFDVIKAAEGKMRSLSETMQTARAGLKSSDEGMLTIEDVSAMAARHASEHVKTFFYDAMRRQQFFHAMRVVWPFAQSFVDTMYRWGRLAAERPYMIEKVGRLGMGLSEPGSNVIYDDFDYIDPFTNRQSYDPSQGFLWSDPATGEQMLTFPLVGSALGAVLSPVAGMMTGEPLDLSSAMQLSAPLRNLNIALQGDVDYLPGAGPMITFPMNVIFPQDAFGALPEWLRAYIFPYGRLRFEEGIVEAGFFPTWARRLTGALWNPEYRAYAVKGSMAYLMSTREYPNFRNDPAVAQQFMDDTSKMASFMALIRAIGAFALPAAPDQDIYAADADGNLIASMYIADRWNHLLEATGRDSEKATAALAETYGLETIAAIAGPASDAPGGDVPFSGAAWEFFKDNPKRGEPFADVLGYFFPGDYSFESNQWVRNSRRRRSLSVAERTANLQEFLYFAERRMLEGRAAQEGWDAGAIREAEDELNAMYADVIPVFQVGKIDREIAKIRRALDKFPELRSTRGGEGAALILESLDTHLAEAERRYGPGSTLKSRRAVRLRESFLTEVDQIAAQYGGYNLAEGSVDTIAGMVARLVEPEE